MKCILLMGSVHKVMKAEKVLKSAGVLVDLVPVLREISSDCGVAIEFDSDHRKDVLDLLKKEGFPGLACYAKRPGKGFEKVE
jgi:hypothetical protein